MTTIDQDFEAWEKGDFVTYGRYVIKPSKDFGTEGTLHDHAWVVTESGVNPLPGATWAYSRADAIALVDILEAVDKNDKKFWHLLRALQHYAGESVASAGTVPRTARDVTPPGAQHPAQQAAPAVPTAKPAVRWYVVSYGQDSMSMTTSANIKDYAIARRNFVEAVNSFSAVVLMNAILENGGSQLIAHWDNRGIDFMGARP